MSLDNFGMPINKMIPALREETRITRISHDFSDKTTWWQNGTKVLAETLTDSGDHLTYNFANTYLINADKVSDRNIVYSKVLLDANVMQKVGLRIYFHKIYVNDVLQSLSVYTINHPSGTITFNSALQPTDVVKADYYYATTSAYKVTPPSGKKWRLYRTEVQFSKGINLKPVVFKVRAAGGAVIADERTYYNAQDYYNHSNLAFNAPAGAGLTQDVVIIPWDYETSIDLKSSLAMDLYCEVENDIPMTNAEIATATFYMFEETE